MQKEHRLTFSSFHLNAAGKNPELAGKVFGCIIPKDAGPEGITPLIFWIPGALFDMPPSIPPGTFPVVGAGGPINPPMIGKVGDTIGLGCPAGIMLPKADPRPNNRK